jgi:S1-C subfamily serine protease
MTASALLLALLLQEDHPGVRATHEAVRKAFVGVDVHLRKKTRLEKADLDEEAQDPELQRLAQLAEADQPLETWAVAVEKNLLLMPERGLRAEGVERIDVLDASGTRFEAKLHAVGRNFDFVLLKPSTPLEFLPLAFADWTRPALGESFHVTYAERAEGRWHLNVSPYIQTNAPLVPEKGWFCLDVLRAGAVVSDAKGAPVGIALDQYLWVRDDGRSSFLGKAILADERLTDLETRYAAIRKTLADSVKRIEISLRSDRPQERFMPADDPRAGRLTVFGLLVDGKGTLLVPDGLPRETIRRIEDITVTDGGRTVPATFVASFRSFGALLLRAEGLAGAPVVDLSAAAPAPGSLFLTAAVDDRFGRSRLRFDYNRLFRTERGLGGVDRLRPRFRIRAGGLLLDLSGRVIGFATADKKEEDLDELALEAGRERFGYDRFRGSFSPDHLRRLVFFSEVAAALAEPAAHADAKAVPMTKRDEKRLVWLGVEFQELSKPLAESLGIQERDLSNDGRRGLLVTELYADSPAEKAGIRLDDVLLSVRPAGEPARDLVAEPDRFGGAFPRGGRSGSARGASLETLWKPTKNYLTTMLTEIGAGKKATFEVLRGREKRAVDITLELAPPDSETAERDKDDVLGLTAKELTYEVRHFQKLERGQTGVLVVRVESGSRADIAKLPPLSIITRVNGEPVRDLAHYKGLVAASRSLTLTTVLFGQTKLVELSRD